MNDVSTLDLESGRSKQKLRTRDALVSAARDLVRDGQPLTVESAAEHARISRTTAYRYFPNRRAILAAAHPETAAASLLGDDPPDDVRERLSLVIDAMTALIVETEPQLRMMLRLSLEPRNPDDDPLPLRQGRAIGWIREALAPLEDTLDESQLGALARALRATAGIEALVWLTDIGGLSREAARDLMRWSAQALLDAAVDSPPPTP